MVFVTLLIFCADANVLEHRINFGNLLKGALKLGASILLDEDVQTGKATVTDDGKKFIRNVMALEKVLDNKGPFAKEVQSGTNYFLLMKLFGANLNNCFIIIDHPNVSYFFLAGKVAISDKTAMDKLKALVE